MVSDLIVVASFAALSVRSLPGMFECPGTYCIKMDDEIDDKNWRMEVFRGLHDESASRSDWLNIQVNMEVWTELAFMEVHWKAGSVTAISSS